MQITLTLYCSDSQSAKIKKNGNKKSQKQNYFCKNCGRQFIGNHAVSYKGCYSELKHKTLRMLACGVGIRDITEIEQISVKKVLSVLTKSNHKIKPN